MKRDNLRTELSNFLQGGDAYLSIEEVLRNFPAEKINKEIPGVAYTPYQLMEHIRIAQWDIIEFTKDQNHKSPEWPNGFWPGRSGEATIEDWELTVKQYFNDLDEFKSIINDKSINLTDDLPNAEGFTYLREILLIISHNSYHLGQLMLFAKTS